MILNNQKTAERAVLLPDKGWLAIRLKIDG